MPPTGTSYRGSFLSGCLFSSEGLPKPDIIPSEICPETTHFKPCIKNQARIQEISFVNLNTSQCAQQQRPLPFLIPCDT